MNFDITFEEAKELWKKWLAYEKDSDTYDICVFADTSSECGFLPKSDVICVFASKTGDLIAFTERVSKVDFSPLARWNIIRKGKHLIKRCPYDYEGFINDKGEFIEYQFYKRWWYDIARDCRNLGSAQFTAN